jgi:hypothetical protein
MTVTQQQAREQLAEHALVGEMKAEDLVRDAGDGTLVFEDRGHRFMAEVKVFEVDDRSADLQTGEK